MCVGQSVLMEKFINVQMATCPNGQNECPIEQNICKIAQVIEWTLNQICFQNFSNLSAHYFSVTYLC